MYLGQHFGNFAGAYFGSIGEYVPAATPIEVIAVRAGYFGGEYREVGEVFDITLPQHYSPFWMQFRENPPTGWTSFLRSYTVASDILRLRWPGRDETRITGTGLDRPDD